MNTLKIENLKVQIKNTDRIILDGFNLVIKSGEIHVIMGPNGVGKSTVFHALNLFFRQSKDSQTDLLKLSANDFHHSNINEPIKVTVTFSSLSDQAKEDLADYVRQDKLVVLQLEVQLQLL